MPHPEIDRQCNFLVEHDGSDVRLRCLEDSEFEVEDEEEDVTFVCAEHLLPTIQQSKCLIFSVFKDANPS